MELAPGPLFVEHPQFHLFWILALVAAAAAVALALYALVRGHVSRELGLAGLVLLPGVAVLLANVEVVDRSREMSFCGSCHEPMAPLMASVIEDNGSLASIHYQSGAVEGRTACYTCHSGYGLQGDLTAKRAGLRHMWHQYWGSYEYPLALNRPFDIDACLDCHRHAPKFRAVPFHNDPDTQAQLAAREISCTGACHPSAHPPEALNGSGTTR
jgi:hypothetical protein